MKTTATGNAVLRAYSRAVKTLQDNEYLVSASRTAGFVIPNGQKKGQREGYQVFVQVCKFSEKLLKTQPLSGGLLFYKRTRK